MEQDLSFDMDLIGRYNLTGPRYTSYPTALEFSGDFGEHDYREQARLSNDVFIPKPLSLYFHLPFCSTICFYCACTKVVTKNRARAAPYLQRLHREIASQGALFDRDRTVDQLHWGGGTPTFLSHDEMRELMRITAEHFTLRNDDRGEYSIEIDPRGVGEDTISLLRELGFNRISMGVQDFDPRVQKAVNRNQSEAETLAALNAARSLGFNSISLDLIYGLPLQTPDSFARTVDKVIAAAPDRLSVFNYAHLPESFKPQRQINATDLPKPAEKLRILQSTIERLNEAGYVYIGMDHFARPDDPLALAQRNGTLQRNFQGYSTHADRDLIGLGMSAISTVNDCYSQNARDLQTYCERNDINVLPVMRGFKPKTDDLLRREIIMQLVCHFELDICGIEEKWGIQFKEYFRLEQQALETMQVDGLLVQNEGVIRVLPEGRLLVRHICRVFDRYSRQREFEGVFSKVI